MLKQVFNLFKYKDYFLDQGCTKIGFTVYEFLYLNVRFRSLKVTFDETSSANCEIVFKYFILLFIIDTLLTFLV